MTELIDQDLAETLNNAMYTYSSKDERHYAGDFAEDGSIYTYNTCDKYQSIERLLKDMRPEWLVYRPNKMWFGAKPETAGVWMNDKDFKKEAIKAGVYKVMKNGTKKDDLDLYGALDRAISKVFKVMVDGTYINQVGVHFFTRKNDAIWDSEKRAVRNHLVKFDQGILSYTKKDLRTTVEASHSTWTYEHVPRVNFYDTDNNAHALRKLARLIAENDIETIDYVDHLSKVDYDYLVNALRYDRNFEDYFKPALMVLGESEHGRKFDFKTIY